MKRYLHDKASAETISDTDAPTTNSGTLMGLIGGLANRLRAITGKASWRDAPDATLADAATHHGRTDNPHSVTRGQLGAAAATALDSHTADRANPHSVTAAQAGAAPTTRTISTSAPLTGGGSLAANRTLTISDATPSARGAMPAADKAKLDGVEAGATTDMTDAEVAAAIQRTDGSGSGLDADLLDGQHAGAFAMVSHGHAIADLPVAPDTVADPGMLVRSTDSRLDASGGSGGGTPGERVFNVEEYGAVGDGITDCTAAFQQILDEIVALRAGGTLYIPPGEFRTGYVQPTGYDATTPAGLVNISVRGEGQGVSNVLIDNPTGFFRIDTHNRSSQFMFYDFTVVAMRANAGRALQVYVPEGGNQHKRGFLAQNVEIRGGQIDRDYFDYGLKSRGLWRPLFQNFVVAGPYGPNVGRYDPNDYVFSPTCCVDVEGAYAPTLWNTYLWSAKTLFSHTAAEIPGPEGGSINRCFFVEGLTGLKLESLSDEPYFAVTHSHVNCMHFGVDARSKRFIMIESNLFYSVNYQGSGVTPQPYADIRLNDASEVMVKDSYFHIQGNATRDNIRIENDVFDVSIDGNNFNSVESMPVRFAGTNISNVVQRNNDVDLAIPAITNDHALLRGEGRLLWSPVAGMVSWTNMPAAETEFLGSTAYRFRLDFSVYTAVSLRVTMDGSALGAAISSLTLQARDAGGAWADVIGTLISAGGPRGNNFASIPAGVRQAGQTECRIVGRGGDGAADPRMTFVGVMAR